MTVFFTADTHFSHKDGVQFFKRPFDSAYDMNQALINNWNSTVGFSDTVYHLGDFGWWEEDLPLTKVFKDLAGHKILVLGNNDCSKTRTLPWAGVVERMSLSIKGQLIHLSHWPVRGRWPGKEDGAWNFHGHLHGNKGKIIRPPNRVDVGVDCWNFFPVTFEQIKYHLLK